MLLLDDSPEANAIARLGQCIAVFKSIAATCEIAPVASAKLAKHMAKECESAWNAAVHKPRCCESAQKLADVAWRTE